MLVLLLFRHLRAACALTILVASLVIPRWIGAIEHHHVERFTSGRYCDVLHTTALWDSTAGELKLRPFEMTLVGSYDTPGTAYDIDIAGDYAYVTDGSSGLQVISIANPSSPTSAGSYDTPGIAYGVAVAGNYAYVTDSGWDGWGGLVIDITNPSAPTLGGSYYSPSIYYDIAVSGNYAYVGFATLIFTGGVGVMDITDPTNPISAGGLEVGDDAYDIVISGDYAYVASGSWGLEVLSIADPLSLSWAGSYNTAGTAYGVAVDGDYAYVASGGAGLWVINISNPSGPTLAGSFDTPGTAYGVAIDGDYAYVADGSSGLQAINISDPSSPTLVGVCDTPGSARNVAISGDYAYVADGSAGLQIINISDLFGPTLTGGYDTPGSAFGIAIAGDYAYVGDRSSGLQVANIINPWSPTSAGSYDTPGSAYGVAVEGDHAYVADESSGLQVINIANPSSPTFAGNYNTPGLAFDVAISGDHVYVADGSSGLQVVNITNPSSPTSAGSYNTAGTAYGVAVDGDYAFVADGSLGLQVVNIANPSGPTPAGSYNTPGIARDVAIAGNHAYVTDEDSGLQVINITNPTSPTLAGSYNTSGSAYSVVVSGDRAYVADGLSGLQILDISNPSSPTPAGDHDTPGSARGLVIAGDYTYVADWGSGLQVLQVYQRLVDVPNNRGQSLVLNTLRENIVKVKLTTAQSDSIQWEVSATDGASWQSVSPDGNWESISICGPDLIWRSTHLQIQSMVNPTCTQLDIGWLHNCAVIDSIIDVPGDEGGWVSIYFARSGFDFTEESTYPIASYKIYRRTSGSEMGIRQLSGELPPGTWELVDSFASTQQEQYTRVVQSLADSMSTLIYSVYCVLAEATSPPANFYSPPDSGYSVDNLPPEAPIGLAGDYGYPPPQLLISWATNAETDLSHYAVHKGDNEGFIPSTSNRLGMPTDTFYVDDGFDPEVDNYYKVSAWDIHENRSDYSLLRPDELTDVSGPPAVPSVTLLEQNVPNPFNPVTEIRFSIAEPGLVTLVVYDVAGRRVRTLVDGNREPHCYEVTWDGRDDGGRVVASGVYLYQLETSGHRDMKKMVLLR